MPNWGKVSFMQNKILRVIMNNQDTTGEGIYIDIFASQLEECGFD